jgi:hypothetical protein
MKLCHASALVLIGLMLFSLDGRIARAQSQLVPPAPKSAPTKSSKPMVDSNGNLMEQGEGNTPPPFEAPQNALEIPQVPKPFEGCWEGTITEPDSWERVKGPRIAGYIPHTDRLCFKKLGDEPFTITFHDIKVDSDYASKIGYPISNIDEQTDLVSTDGHNEVSLHSVVSFDERGKLLGLIPSSVTRISTTRDAHCLLVDDGAALNVEASQTTRCSGSWGCNGQVWVRATWHSHFHKVPAQ